MVVNIAPRQTLESGGVVLRMDHQGKPEKEVTASLATLCDCQRQIKKVTIENQNEKPKEAVQDMAPYTADVLDPFALRRRMSLLQYLKSIVLTVTLLPIRLLLMLSILVVAWFIAVLTLIGLPKEQANNMEPLSGWRRKYAKPLIVALARVMFVVGGWYWMPQKGRRATAREAPILLVTPHSSFLDTVVVIALGCPGMVVIEATGQTPLFGSLIRYQQPLLVRTDDPNARHQVAEDIQKRVTSGKDWEQLLLFPEGGCGNRKALLQFKHGSFTPGVPVQPVFIRYKNSLDSVTWTWNGPGGLEQLWLTLTQFRIYCELEFLPVYNPSKEEREDPLLYADNVQSYVAKLTGTPTSRFSLADARFVQQARKMHLPPTAPLVKLLRLRKSIGREDMDPEDELKLLRENMASLQQTHGGAREMAAYLGLPRCPEALKDFFHVMDQEGKNSIDLHVYDAGLCLIKTDMKDKDKLKSAFECFESQTDTETLDAILLLWKGVPQSVSKLKSIRSLDKTEKELSIL